MKVDTSGIKAFGRALMGVGASTWSDAAHDAVVDEFKDHQYEIPKLSGALRKAILRKAILRKGDRKHRWVTDGNSARLEIDLIQAATERHRLPIPDPETIGDAIAQSIDDELSAQSFE